MHSAQVYNVYNVLVTTPQVHVLILERTNG